MTIQSRFRLLRSLLSFCLSNEITNPKISPNIIKMTALVERKNNWEATESNFQWEIPYVFNIAEAVYDRHAEDPAKVALIHENESGTVESWTFRQIQQYANRLANAMEALGICEGDRVGIVLPQSPETGIAHIAIYKIGAVALPLANLFGPEALKYLSLIHI